MNTLQNSFVKVDTRLQKINPRLIIPLGALAGVLLGVMARLWMRWISTEPEFSWSGSIFIVLAITIFFTAHSTVYFALRKKWSRRSIAITRSAAIVFSLPMFSAAGAMMLPTVVTASIAAWRNYLPKWVRVTLGLASLVIPVMIVKDFGDDFGWGIATAGRILLFGFIYGAVIAMTRSTVAKFPGGKPIALKREIMITLAVLFVLFVGVRILMFGVGGDGS